MFHFIKDIIAPKKCYSCGQEWHFLCPLCLSKMTPFEPICYVCKGKTEHFFVHNSCRQWIYYDQLIVSTHYKNPFISYAIKQAKFYGKKDVLEDISSFLWETLLKNYCPQEDDIILWVPLYFWKKIHRWYNQSDYMARIIAKKNHIFYGKNILKKIKSTRQQSHLNRQQRQENIRNCFQINKKYRDIIDKKNIILVDDVVSTGSTLNEIAKLLKHHGAQKVICLCFASD